MRAPIALALLLVAPFQLSEADSRAAELHQTKVALLQCQIAAATAALTADQQQLEARFRAILNPPAGAIFNWQTLAFESPTK